MGSALSMASDKYLGVFFVLKIFLLFLFVVNGSGKIGIITG